MAASSGTPPLNAVYYPSWRIYKGIAPSHLQLDYINRVYYAFILANEDGTLRSLDTHADHAIAVDGASGCITATARLKHISPLGHGLQILASIGGGSGSAPFPALAASPAARETFARECRHFVDAHGFDGVDIDWEHPQDSAAGADYIALLATLRQHLPAPRYLLTTALPVGQWVLRHIDLRAAAGLLDSLNLMAYDFTGSWTEVCGHQAQLLAPGAGAMEDCHPVLRKSAHEGVEYVVSRGFPRDKIVLGVPAYARSFAGARGAGQPFGGAEEMDYVDLPREWIHHAQIDQRTGAAWYVDDDGNGGGKGFVSFDVPETVRQKGAYARTLGLGGLFYWTGAGDINGPESLVKAGYEGLRR
ncbi:glycoside hydrolase superfamily [Microdochium trichocladiopsis]|uniref:chitinase n=1 Tax=Microdochium trichocladiopsis TaxID=1682393 RepID=A0A9P8YKU4_9PEZI|nr:glycoside hydrolase superfamily [Microdochium trichocladiopsis]KAH7041356.1 glycoside hydrolase superfamily [Microdochium trichocladiopsis]